MSTKAERGTKRTCQNPECGSRFYDLNRDPVVCPICQTAYQVGANALAMAAVAPAVADKAAQRKAPKKPAYPVESSKPAEAPESDADEALAAIEDEEEPAVADEDETFLEAEEEDGTDMSNIIGGPVTETDEQQ
ncbi:MAG: TIGR02300 family protein [Hyphomonadaceae bacterium]|nr:TIGR02300 family protein [Hyphomonadaceae bacterium]